MPSCILPGHTPITGVECTEKPRASADDWKSSSDFFGDDVGGAVGAAKHDVGFVVADDLLGGGIEGEGAAEAIGSVGQVDERAGNVGFLDGGMNVLGAAAANAIDEIGVVVAGGFAVGAGFELIGEPGFVGVVAVDGENAF